MIKTFTRKFLVSKLPDISNKERIEYERYYLYIGEGIVIRIQSIGDEYELERKVDVDQIVRDEEKIKITKDEFEKLSKIASYKIVRDSYNISENPNVVLRIYHNQFEGLNRVEVNFSSLPEALEFTPLSWFGKEIAETPLAKDGKLLVLRREEFKKLISS